MIKMIIYEGKNKKKRSQWSVLHFIYLVHNSTMISGLVFSHPSHTNWQLTCVYGPTNPIHKHQFWENRLDIKRTWKGLWVIMSDFNAALDQKDKQGGRPVVQSSSSSFRQFINTGALLDMGFKGPNFTWNNRRAGKVNIQEHIDRGFINI